MGSASATEFETYFASINPLAAKISQERDCLISSLGDRWHEMTASQRRWAEDHYFFGHAHDKEDDGEGDFDEELLQALRIRGGDRVIIDFDQDSWTWMDVHSGLFSWMTRSQEDLTIEDIFSNKEPPKSPKLPRIATRIRTSSGDSGNSFIRNSPFVAADRGEVVSFKRDSADENIFAKYGIRFGLNGDQLKDNENSLSTQTEQSDSKTETNSEYTSSEGSQHLHFQKRASLEDILQLGPEGIGLIKNRHYGQLGSASESHTPETMSIRSRESHTLDAAYRYIPDQDPSNKPLAGSASEVSLDSKTSSPDVTPAQIQKLKKGKKWWSPKKEKTDSTNSLLSVQMSSQKEEAKEDLGQLSPVFIEEPGESCDYEETVVQSVGDDSVHLELEMPSNLATLDPGDSSVMPDARHLEDISHSTTGGFINPALSTTLEEEDWKATSLSQDDQKDGGSGSVIKTGFDFLDNW